MKYLILVSAALVIVATSYAGFMGGAYVTSQQYEKRALAHQCGTLDAKTLAFVWNAPMSELDVFKKAVK